MTASIIAIDDLDDPRVDEFRNIKDVDRRRAGSFIAESEMVIRRLFASQYPVRSVLLVESRARRLAPELDALDGDVPVFVAPQNIVDALVGFPLHRGGMALADRVAHPHWRQLSADARTMLILEDVVDPDNVGAVFRHCAAFGVGPVVLSPHAGDPLYRKAVRASMGWSLHIPWTRMSEAEWPTALDDMRADGWRVLALTPNADAPVLRVDGGHHRTALMLGSEHEGLTPTAFAHATSPARIPMAGGVDSLNVATSAAIALYEITRSVLQPHG